MISTIKEIITGSGENKRQMRRKDMVLRYTCVLNVNKFMKTFTVVVRGIKQHTMKTFPHIKWKEGLVSVVKKHEWTEIVQSLLQQIKELKEEVHLLKSILHSNITILGEEKDES